MSLEFAGYSATLFIKHATDDTARPEVSTGWSDPGPNCSPAQAMANAILDPKAQACFQLPDWQRTFELRIMVEVNTRMPR